MKKMILMMMLFSTGAFAQEDTTANEEPFEYNVFKEKVYFWQLDKNWKFSPLEVFSVMPTLGVDLETKMTKNLSFQYGAAYVPSFLQFVVREGNNGFNSMNGYKLRFESRYYGMKKPGRYFAAGIQFRHLIIQDEMVLGINPDENGNFEYFQTQDAFINSFQTRLEFKFGINKVYDSGFVIDFYGGLSLRNQTAYGPKNLAENQQFAPEFNLLDFNSSGKNKINYITPIIGFKLGFNQPAKRNL